MQINGKNVLSFNAVAGDSQATGVGGTASVPSGLVESGMTLYQGASTFAYFSMGSTSAFNGLSYTQLSEGQSYQNIQFLNQETSFVNIPY
ncbi:hypothetical protein DFR87_06210 [Metallosphaera hakonensis JCM 8857 = DSM 7519]|uniref:Uncharacterized protein n=2 Tax=Metallosphaera hakonensis TaxID=79601 RepID=A0A2U9IX50_9CREN|nr:hypothetical protein DFR87_06210 [Metallosphaera hakonensis JCM 8857 = DSM 7519]